MWVTSAVSPGCGDRGLVRLWEEHVVSVFRGIVPAHASPALRVSPCVPSRAGRVCGQEGAAEGRPACRQLQDAARGRRVGRAPFPSGSWLEEPSLRRGAALLLWVAVFWPPLELLPPSRAKRASVRGVN